MKHKIYAYQPKIRDYLITELLKIQNKKCSICEEDFKDSKKIHVDHDHITDEIRGLLCPRCNHSMAIIDNITLKTKCENYKNTYHINLKDLEPKVKLKKEQLREETRIKRSQKRKTYFKSKDNIDKKSKETISQWENKEYREKQKKSKDNYITNEEYIKNQSNIKKDYFSNINNRENMSNKKKEYFSNPENRIKQSNLLKEYWKNKKIMEETKNDN